MIDTSPTWSALAITALARLRQDRAELGNDRTGRPAARHAAPGEARSPKMSETRNLDPLEPPANLLAWLDDSPTATQIPNEGQDAFGATGWTPPASEGEDGLRPAVHLPATDLSLMFRLCATIGSEGRLAEMMAPGVVTVVEIGPDTGGMAPSDVRSMLEMTILPQEAEVISAGRFGDVGDAPDLRIIELAAEDPGQSRIKNTAFQLLLRGLEAPGSVLILAETLSHLPDDVRRVLPVPRRLAPLSRDIVMAVIAASHGATGDIDPALRDCLPDDRILARLSDAALALALRAEAPRAVVGRLSELAQDGSERGPTLADIEGHGEAEAAARRMVADLQDWAEGHVAWTDVQRSVLFWGPPGTGKSHLARAMAGSAGVALVRGSFATWQSQGNLSYMLRAMRASFDEAAAARPAILVIDEIDAVGDRADPDLHNASYRQQVINAFLEALDGLEHIEGVMLVGTTNYPDKIDAAVLRPGRIDIKAQVPLPGPKALARMIRDGLGQDIPPKMMARLTRAAAGQSAADVDSALRAARSTARATNRIVTAPDLLTALDPDPEEQSPARERRIAIHECGHVIVGTCLGLGQIKRVVLTRQGGQAWLSYAIGEQMLKDIEAELAYSLAGRAAERLVLGNAAAGAGGNSLSDLAQATRSAAGIDTHFGLGTEGPVWLDTSCATYLRNPENAARIRARLEAAEARAAAILDPRRDLLTAMAANLVEVGLLEGVPLDAWLDCVRETCAEAANVERSPDSAEGKVGDRAAGGDLQESSKPSGSVQFGSVSICDGGHRSGFHGTEGPGS